MKTFHSNGKLLITGEYAVLDGALSLALPTKKGQSLSIYPQEKGFAWKSYDINNRLWYETDLLPQISPIHSNDPTAKITATLANILATATELNPNFTTQLGNYRIETHLEFERDWGLGSSSTLINNIAQWAEVNPFELLFKSFGGSGYDIACAKTNTPILYKLEEGIPKIYPLYFTFPYKNQIYFIHLNKKQNSKEGISLYKSITKSKKNFLQQITEITENIIRTNSFSEFYQLIDTHENIIADFLKIKKVKDLYFPDFNGSIKSLGAWGGDFILAISDKENIPQYFNEKGFSTIITYEDMVI
ncbi:MAG: GYDIA family GHMP kinase [Capnocytophaga sp.]|nr:GYDIA family GHMP kinase [Capnocytophaga sp.]